MNRIIKHSLAAALFAAAGFSAAFAHGYKVGELEIGHPWAKVTVAGSKVGGGYLTVTNNGKEDDRLVSVSTDRAPIVQLHEMKVENDVMKMREIPGGIVIPAGQTVELKPGALHVMFMDIPQPFVEGEKINAHLTFEKAGAVDVQFNVQKAPAEHGAMDHSDHGKMDMNGKKP